MDIISILLPVAILGGLGTLFGALLGFASKKFAVEEDPLPQQLREFLPGANCGGCGYVGCDDYAKAMAKGEAKPGKCAVGGETCSKECARLLGVQMENAVKMVAYVSCAGSCDNAVKKGEYYGAKDCREASLLPGSSDKLCAYGCLGMGTCVSNCMFDAISIQNGVAVVDPVRCQGCGACVKECPKHVISLIPADSLVRVACSNKEKGKPVMDACKVSCIGCGMCAKVCPQETIQIVSNLPVINYEGCVGCGFCVEKCPRHTLHILEYK